MPQIFIYLPVLESKKDGKKTIVFRPFIEGNLAGFLPVSSLPLPDEQTAEQKVEDAWREILKHLKLFHLYVNYHRCEKKLVIAQITRKSVSPVRGRRLGEFFLDDRENVVWLVETLKKMSKGQTKLPDKAIIKFELPYKYLIE